MSSSEDAKEKAKAAFEKAKKALKAKKAKRKASENSLEGIQCLCKTLKIFLINFHFKICTL